MMLVMMIIIVMMMMMVVRVDGGRGTGRPDEGREGRRETIKELKVHLRIPLLFIHSC